MTKTAVIAVVVAGCAATAGFASRAALQKVTLTATDNRFMPTTIHAVAGQSLEITIVNHGTRTHGLRLVLSRVPGEVPFPENVPPGRTMSRVFDNLGDPGTYRFYCPVDDDARHGMEGTLIVSPPE